MDTLRNAETKKGTLVGTLEHVGTKKETSVGTSKNAETKKGTHVETLRFKVTVSPSDVELYKIMDQAKPYYRSRRLIQLAHIGMLLEKGQLLNVAPAPNTAQIPVLAVDKSHLASAAKLTSSTAEKTTHYAITEDSSAAVARMLGALDDGGFGV